MTKKTLFIIKYLLLIVLVAGCTPNPSHAGVSTSIPTTDIEPGTEGAPIEATPYGFSEEYLLNSELFAPFYGENVQLTDGEAVVEGEYGDSRFFLLPQMAFGNLNDDGAEDAAVLLAENGGGTGTFVSLIVFLNEEGIKKQIGNRLIDDRPRIQSISIEDGRIVLDALIHNIGDAMATPTLQTHRSYQLFDEQLILTECSSSIQDGEERSITIDAPVDGQSVSGTVELKGTMPIAPFENNLRLAIYDSAGNLLSEAAFMVDAEDVGMPAVFNNSITLPEIPTGSLLRIELSDLSMADGSLIAMDSVSVEVK